MPGSRGAQRYRTGQRGSHTNCSWRGKDIINKTILPEATSMTTCLSIKSHRHSSKDSQSNTSRHRMSAQVQITGANPHVHDIHARSRLNLDESMSLVPKPSTHTKSSTEKRALNKKLRHAEHDYCEAMARIPKHETKTHLTMRKGSSNMCASNVSTPVRTVVQCLCVLAINGPINALDANTNR